MKKIILFLFLVTGLASAASAATVAYWRMGDGDPCAIANAALPDSNGQTVWRKAVNDDSENGNHLTTWDYAWAGFNWRIGGPNVPLTNIPITGASNNFSIEHIEPLGCCPAAMTWSAQSSPGGIDINDITPEQFTIEASFKATSGGWAHTVVGRDGSNVNPDPTLAPLYFGFRNADWFGGLGRVVCQFVDMAGNNWTAISDPCTMKLNKWYNMVAVSDGSTLKLYLDDVAADKGYQLVAQTDISSSTDPRLAKGNTSGPPIDLFNSGAWSVGRGLYNGQHVDRLFGYIDEVRISDTALKPSQFLFQQRATEPYPSDGGLYNGTSVTLGWLGAGNADKHDVYFSDDFNDVNDANSSWPIGPVYKGRIDPNTYNIPIITRGKTYYWRIDEVNGARIWKGDVWSFLVQPLKAYNPSPADGAQNQVLSTALSWSPGAYATSHDIYFGTTNPPPFVTNQAGTSYIPTTPLVYDTNYFWRIDEVNATPNKTIGDVWTFKTLKQILPSDPNLVGLWTFDEGAGSALDWSGLNQHGTLYGGPQWVAGYDGGAYKFDGDNDYISLPIGETISTLNSITVATWVNFSGAAGSFQRIFDFGNDPNEYMFMTPRYGWTTGPLRFAITLTSWDGNPGEFSVENPGGASGVLPTGWHHVAISLNGDYQEMTLYLDAVPVDTQLTGVLPSDLGSTVKNWLGKSQYSGDAYFDGILDDFRIYKTALTQEEIKKIMSPKEAWLPDPANFEERVNQRPTLSWLPGKYAPSVNGHKLYFSTDYNDVNDRDPNAFIGTLTDPCYVVPAPPAPLESLTTYYWVVDEVNGVQIWPGNVWRFTIRDLSVIDDFEDYPDTGYPTKPGTLRKTWIDGRFYTCFTTGCGANYKYYRSGSFVQLSNDSNDGTTNPDDIIQNGEQAMKFYYDNDGTIRYDVELYKYDSSYQCTAPKYSEAYVAIDDSGRLTPASQESRRLEKDFSGYKGLRIPYYGDPTNTVVAADKLYVTLRDANLVTATVSNPDHTIIQNPGWSNWDIPISKFTTANPKLALTNIIGIYIGIGTKSAPATGGHGVVFFDDIQLLAKGICVKGSVVGDLDNDCAVDANDLQIMTRHLYGEKPASLPNPIINLDATTIAASPVTIWTNNGSLGGFFRDFSSYDTNAPILSTIDGKKAVTFRDVNDLLVWDYNAPATITDGNDFTVVLEVWNLDVGVEEWVLAWASRNGPNGSFAAFGYGTQETWGAVAHYGAAYDMGFGPMGAPSAHTWHTIAITYDGTTESIIVDGLIYAQENKNLVIDVNEPVVIGGVYEPNSQGTGSLKGGWQPVWSLRYIGSVASIKVYAEAIPPEDLALWFGSPADLFPAIPDNKVNFKDIAVFATKWLVGLILLE